MSGSSQGNFRQLATLPSAPTGSDGQARLGIRYSRLKRLNLDPLTAESETAVGRGGIPIPIGVHLPGHTASITEYAQSFAVSNLVSFTPLETIE